MPDRVHVEVKLMFADLGAFANGNVLVGLFGDLIGIKLPDAPGQRRHHREDDL